MSNQLQNFFSTKRSTRLNTAVSVFTVEAAVSSHSAHFCLLLHKHRGCAPQMGPSNEPKKKQKKKAQNAGGITTANRQPTEERSRPTQQMWNVERSLRLWTTGKKKKKENELSLTNQYFRNYTERLQHLQVATVRIWKMESIPVLQSQLQFVMSVVYYYRLS